MEIARKDLCSKLSDPQFLHKPRYLDKLGPGFSFLF